MFPPVVVGAGACGLAAAVVLHQEGYDPTVFERAPGPPGGAVGQLVGTNGLRVLDHVGVADAVAAAGQPIDRLRVVEANGRTLARLDFAGFEDRAFGWTPVSIGRTALLEALEAALPDGAVQYGREVTTVAHQAGDEQVQLADGEVVPSSLVVGADGVRSAVRRTIVPDATVRTTGWFAYRGLATEAVADHLRAVAWEVWGPATRLSFAPVGPERVAWTAYVDGTLGPTERPAELLAALSERCTGYPEPVRTLLARTAPDTVAVDPVLDLAPIDRWHGRAIALAGDAAHAAVPWLGLGTGLALVDAHAIGERLRGVDSTEGALDVYEEARKPAADWVGRRARQLHVVATTRSPSLRAVRNRALRLVPEPATRRWRRRLAATS